MVERKPSEIRKDALAGHVRIRARLGAMRHQCQRLREGERAALAPLRTHAESLLDALLDHLALEHRELLPALRETPGFGQVRVEELLELHAEQRGVVTETVERLRAEPGDLAGCAEEVLALIDRLRHDLVWEDRELLDPEVLRDDPIDVSLTS